MIDMISSLVDSATEVLLALGPISGIIIVMLESILPMLPLGVFIALNINAFGFFFGFFTSWIATCIGCLSAYYLFSFLTKKVLFRIISMNSKKKILKLAKRFKKISFSSLVILIALPFTPAFLINIAAGITNIEKKKFLLAILIGKLSVVFFWAYVGKSLIESITDITSIIKVSILVLGAFLISKLVENKTEIN